jgi:hypothetical protein
MEVDRATAVAMATEMAQAVAMVVVRVVAIPIARAVPIQAKALPAPTLAKVPTALMRASLPRRLSPIVETLQAPTHRLLLMRVKM